MSIAKKHIFFGVEYFLGIQLRCKISSPFDLWCFQMDSGTPERFLEAITFLPKKDILFDNLLIKWCCEPVTISGVWWRFSILEPKKARTPRLNRVRSPSSGGVRQCFDMENVGMLVKFHLHPTRAETDAPPRRYRKGGGFFLKWPNHWRIPYRVLCESS